MKAFQFRLDRVLRLRESQLKTEESKLELLLTRRAQMQAEIEALEASLQQATASTKKQPFLRSSELLMLHAFGVSVDRERKEFFAKMAAHDRIVDQQRTLVVAARSRIRLLEKLRDKRKAEWQTESDRELDEVTSDFSTAQWSRIEKRALQRERALALNATQTGSD